METLKEETELTDVRRHSFSSSLLRRKPLLTENETNLRRTQSCRKSFGKSRRVLYRARSKMKMIKVTLSSNEKTPSPEIMNDFDIEVTDSLIKTCTPKQFEKSYKVFFNFCGDSKKCSKGEIIIKEKENIIQKVPISELLDTNGEKTINYHQMKLTASPPEWKLPDLRTFEYNGFLCERELQFLKKRKFFVQSALKKVLSGTETLDNPDKVPHIALMGSGGGYRAMVAMSGIVNALYDTGLLNCILYTVALSGSSWYIASLYSHPEWPDIHPKKIQARIEQKISKNPINFKNFMQYGWDFLQKSVKFKHWNLTTDVFGPLLGKTLLPGRLKCKWSQVAKKMCEGTVPLPLLSAINAKEKGSAKKFHEWVEFSPYEVSIPKYGAAIEMKHFGSEFLQGQVTKDQDELPLFQIMAICGSAFAITYDEYHKKVESKDSTETISKNPLNGARQRNCDQVTGSKGHEPYDELDGHFCISESRQFAERTKEDTSRAYCTNDIINKEKVVAPSNTVCKSSNEEETCTKNPEEQIDVLDGCAPGTYTCNKNLESKSERSAGELLTKDRTKNLSTKESDENQSFDVLECCGINFTTNYLSKDREPPLQDPYKELDDKSEPENDEIKRELYTMFQNICQIREECGLSNADPKIEPSTDEFDGATVEDEVFPPTPSNQDEQDVLDGVLEDVKSFGAKMLGETRRGRAAFVNNFLRKMSFEGHSSLTEANSLFENYLKENPDKLCVIDAGLAFNSPYPLLLQSSRDIDLILSFDFTDRKKDDNKPFKTLLAAEEWAKTHKVTFPNIKDNIGKYEDEKVKELYIFEDEKDVECPIIMHFVLVNNDFRIYKKPGVERDPSEMHFADFKVYDDQSTFHCTNFHYTKTNFDRLSQLAEFIVLNNIEHIKTCIRKSISNKIRRTRERHPTN